jgi:hypothetical protein
MGRKSKMPLIMEALSTANARRRGLTQIELHQVARVSAGCVNDHVRTLHAARQIHICGWLTDVGGSKGSRYQARYRLGDQPDVPKPPALTRAEVARRFRERAIKSGLVEDMRAAGRAYWWKKQPPRRDPLAAALFGAPA